MEVQCDIPVSKMERCGHIREYTHHTLLHTLLLSSTSKYVICPKGHPYLPPSFLLPHLAFLTVNTNIGCMHPSFFFSPGGRVTKY